MHYPNLTFHGVEAIWLGFNTPHRCMYGWQPGSKIQRRRHLGRAPSGLLQVYGQPFHNPVWEGCRRYARKRLFNREPLLSYDLRRCTCSQTRESMAGMKSIRLGRILPAVISAALFIGEVHALSGFPNSQVSANGSTATQGDGSHDFDFLIGDWKAHVRRLPERLKGSNFWVDTTASRIIRSFSTATLILKSSTFPAPITSSV